MEARKWWQEDGNFDWKADVRLEVVFLISWSSIFIPQF